MIDSFDTFWAVYPLRVSRKDAEKALDKALKKTPLAMILAGLETYKKIKPEWQHWAYPASWLNAERWTDEAPMKPEPTFQASHRITKREPDVSPEERKRVGGKMIAFGNALNTVLQNAREAQEQARRERVIQKANEIIARDPRPLASRLGYDVGDEARGIGGDD